MSQAKSKRPLYNEHIYREGYYRVFYHHIRDEIKRKVPNHVWDEKFLNEVAQKYNLPR